MASRTQVLDGFVTEQVAFKTSWGCESGEERHELSLNVPSERFIKGRKGDACPAGFGREIVPIYEL